MPLSESELDLANDFLNRCKALYKTNDFVIEHRDKNIQYCTVDIISFHESGMIGG